MNNTGILLLIVGILLILAVTTKRGRDTFDVAAGRKQVGP